MTRPETCGAAGGALSLWFKINDCGSGGGVVSTFAKLGGFLISCYENGNIS